MSEHIHPLVLATVEDHRARRELELERLRSARNACTTASPGGQTRAMALGKRIREVEAIVAGWRLAMATLVAEVAEDETATDLAALIRAAKEETDEPDPDRVVAYRGIAEPVLHCVRCVNHSWQGWTTITSEDLPDGGVCESCHADVLA